MELLTRFHGKVQISEDNILTFNNGIPGFEEFTRYVLFKEEDIEDNFFYLQSVEEQDICFILLAAEALKKEYTDEINNYSKDGKFDGYLICNLTQVDATVNVKAPIMIDHTEKIGFQMVPEISKYDLKTKLIEVVERG